MLFYFRHWHWGSYFLHQKVWRYCVLSGTSNLFSTELLNWESWFNNIFSQSCFPIHLTLINTFFIKNWHLSQQTMKPRCRNVLKNAPGANKFNKQANQRNDSKHNFSYDGAYPVGTTQYPEVVFLCWRSRGGSVWNFWGFSKSWLGGSGFVESIRSSKDINMRINEIFFVDFITLHNYHIIWNHNNKSIKGSNCSNSLDEND